MRSVVLTIAGSDSGAGAGIQADLKAISANGGYGVSVITSVTAQNTMGVRAAYNLPAAIIEEQYEAVVDDFPVAAVKTGMLADRERVLTVARLLRKRPIGNFVLDPVMISKSGFALLDGEAIDALRTELIPLADLVTPNAHEAQHLTGLAVRNPEEAEAAGKRILEFGARAVLVKGGHFEQGAATDVLVSAAGTSILPGELLDAKHTHGTGCTYSAAIATHLAAGRSMEEAVAVSKDYITEAIRHGLPLGSGTGPTDHFYFLRNAPSGARSAPSAEEFTSQVEATA